MTQKEKSQSNTRPIATKADIKAPVKATRVAAAKRLAVNHNETLLRAVASQP